MRVSWHQRFYWKASDYFNDPKVISLCRAIEANDLEEMNRLISNGADVNAKGKENMTPLLWSFPDNKLDRFVLLLRRGANPNIIVESDFGTRSGIMPGEAVSHMAAETVFDGYFDEVFARGGDPNLISNSAATLHNTPLFCLIEGRAKSKLVKAKTLIKQGANLNYVNGAGATPAMAAVSRGRYDIALALLDAGADYRKYQSNKAQRLVHVVARQDARVASYAAQQKADYQALVDWLNNRGESLEDARADIRRWDSWSRTSGEYHRKMDAEIAEREAAEAAKLPAPK
jgi:ankyrin repeat protein